MDGEARQERGKKSSHETTLMVIRRKRVVLHGSLALEVLSIVPGGVLL